MKWIIIWYDKSWKGAWHDVVMCSSLHEIILPWVERDHFGFFQSFAECYTFPLYYKQIVTNVSDQFWVEGWHFSYLHWTFIQGLLYTWTDSLGIFFATFVIMKIFKNSSNTICRPSKNITFPKIWRVWLKYWVCHALLNFKIKMGVAGSIFELHPPNFVKIHIF